MKEYYTPRRSKSECLTKNKEISSEIVYAAPSYGLRQLEVANTNLCLDNYIDSARKKVMGYIVPAVQLSEGRGTNPFRERWTWYVDFGRELIRNQRRIAIY